MIIKIEKLGIYIDSVNQPYWSYIIVSLGLVAMGIIYMWKH